MRRRRPRLRKWLAWTAACVAPLLLCLAIAYALSLVHFRAELRDRASGQALRVRTILEDGARVLALLERVTGGECNASTMAAMTQAVFHGVHFREAGIERDGNLVCTNLELLPPGFDIPNATRVPAARVGRMEILSPTKTIRGGQSLILNWPQDDSRRAFINLLLDPQELVDAGRMSDGIVSSTVLEDAPNGRTYRFAARTGTVTEAPAALPLRDGVYNAGGDLHAVVHAAPYPFHVITSIRGADLREYWLMQVQPAALAGFLLSALAFLLLRRSLPRVDARQDLREGIEADEFELEYQPIVDAERNEWIGAEALARWRHPQRGTVMPDDFIPLAESSGLISPLTERVLAIVKRDLEHLAPLPARFRISINLARAQLADDSLLLALDRIFGPDARLDRLGFEITERELLANIADHARGVVERLAQRDAEVSLDDFGTGYSGLSHLRHLRLHHIKIDRSFVRALDTEAVTASLVESIVALAGTLGLGLVAEGVETESQRTRLLELGVRMQQGWLYARAMPVQALSDRLRAAGSATPGASSQPGSE